MDACLIVIEQARTLGFETAGDFFRDPQGRLTHRAAASQAPYHCFGVEILDPQRVYEVAGDRFSLFQVWMTAAAKGRLFGVVPDGLWMQAGDPASLQAAEARLKSNG
jgi:MurNAc alpha-1-phosphate uridylyltransferase